MTRKTDPTDDELRYMTKHISYDLAQMIAVAELATPSPARTPQENANIDGVLMYARKLLAFLDPPPRRQWREGDVYALDYVSGWEIPVSWWAETNTEVMKAISTRSAHIHLDRLDELKWNVEAIAGTITEAMLSFIKQVPEPHAGAFRRWLTSVEPS